MPESKKSSGFDEAVGAFNQSVLKFADNSVNTLRMSERSDDADAAMGIRDGLAAQTEALSRNISSLMQALAPQEREQLESRVRDSGLGALASSAQSYAASGSIARVGMFDMLEPIKKIIRMILDALGTSLPGWIQTILDIINNLMGVLGNLLGPDFGTRARTAQQTMHNHLQSIYRTNAAQAAYHRARETGRENREDDA